MKPVVRLTVASIFAFYGMTVAGCGTENAATDAAMGNDDNVTDVSADGSITDDEGHVTDNGDDHGVQTDASIDVSGEDAGTDAVSPDTVVPDNGTDVPVTSTEPNYLVVTSDSLAESAGELAQYRESKGYRTKVVTSTELLDGLSAEKFGNQLRAQIGIMRTALAGSGPLFVVLVGDAAADSADGYEDFLPVEICENVIGDCYTDNRYADVNNDNIPDVALGRITASSNAEVRAYLEKVKRHESTYVPGLWNRRVSMYVGQAGFSAQIDSTLETFTFMGLDRVPHSFDIIGAYDSPTSSYYYKPFTSKVVDLINGGSLFTVYIGHGNTGWTQGLTIEQLNLIDCENRLPVMVLLACLTGDFAGTKETISEGLLHLENGPVAVFASTDDSHPVGNAVLAYEVTRVGLAERPGTVGELFMRLKDQLISHTDDFRQLIDEASIAYGEEGCDDPQTLYFQHADLYNLLGDPAVEIRYPSDVTWGEIDGSLAEKHVTVSGTVPGVTSGKAYVTLEVSRNEYVGEIDSTATDEVTIQQNWAVANDKSFVETTVDVVDGSFSAELTWDGNFGGGDRYIKVYAWDGDEFGQGSVDAFGEYWINK